MNAEIVCIIVHYCFSCLIDRLHANGPTTWGTAANGRRKPTESGAGCTGTGQPAVTGPGHFNGS